MEMSISGMKPADVARVLVQFYAQSIHRQRLRNYESLDEAYRKIVVWKADEVLVRVGGEMRALPLEELLVIEANALELIRSQLHKVIL